MEQSLGFKQQLSQQQKLSYQMIQAVSLLSISTTELCESIYEEVEKNPALEIVKDSSIESAGIRIKSTNSLSSSSSSDSDAYQSFLESSPSQGETLKEHLLQQLNISDFLETEKEIAKKIICSLDEKGYFLLPLENIFNNEEYERALKVLPKIQKFDPIGVICKNLQESLELQAKEKLFQANEEDSKIDNETSFLILEILHSHFELLEKPRTNYIHKKLTEKEITCSISQVENALNFIRSLDPYPARDFSVEKPIYINPDVFVRKLSEEELLEESEEVKKIPFVIDLIKTNLPTVKISQDFIDFQKDNPQIKKAVNDAKNFLFAIEQRNSTLLNVCVEIVKLQKDFFEKGSLYLKPLRLKDVAQNIGVHETTVSRISNGKYLQCEWGLFEIKYFFSNAVSVGGLETQSSNLQNSTEGQRSKESIKQELLSILKQEEGKNLSDQKLSDKLAEKGINIARRTVAKYRKELNYDSSYDR